MKQKNEINQLFMRHPDAMKFIGSRRRGRHKERFSDEFEAVRFVTAMEQMSALKGVVTDDGIILWRLDSLLEMRDTRGMSQPEILRNRNTGLLNRVRADGRTFQVKPCRDVLAGEKHLP